jgi:hypothetical protein
MVKHYSNWPINNIVNFYTALIKENIIYYTNSTKTEPVKVNSIDEKTTLCHVAGFNI